MIVILLNLVASVLNILYYILTDNRVSPVNLFVGGVCLGAALMQIAVRRF